MEQQRLSARTAVRTARGVTRSDSRKRTRHSQSPESAGKTKDCHLSKKLRNTSTCRKEQTKITSFSSLAQGDTPDNTPDINTQQTESENMATNNLDDSQFNQIMAQFEKMNTKIDTKIDEHISKIDERMDKMDGKILEIENKLDNTQVDIRNLSQKEEHNTERTVECQHVANTALMYAERNEQYQRNFNLRIFNLSESPNETIEQCEAKVLSLFSDKLGVQVSIEAIDVLHRLGPKSRVNSQVPTTESNPNGLTSSQTSATDPSSPQNKPNEENKGDGDVVEEMDASENQATGEQNNVRQTTTSRPIIVSFVSRRVRREILANRFKLKKQPNQTTAPVIIVEDLTKQRHSLFAKARENKEKFKKVWSKEGRIYARQQNGVDIPIDTFMDITSPPVQSKPHPRTSHPFAARFRGRGFGSYSRGRGRFSHNTRYGQRWGSPSRDQTEDIMD